MRTVTSTIESTGLVAVGGGSMDNTGTYGMTGGWLMLSKTASLTNSGTFNMGGGDFRSEGVDLTNSGVFNMKGGTLGTVDLIGAKLGNRKGCTKASCVGICADLRCGARA